MAHLNDKLNKASHIKIGGRSVRLDDFLSSLVDPSKGDVLT